MLGITSDKKTYSELCWHILRTNFDNGTDTYMRILLHKTSIL